MRKACFEARPGDTVLAAPGVYRHALAPVSSGLSDRRITFRRHGRGKVVLDGGGAVAPLLRLESKNYVTVDGFTMVNLPKTGRTGAIVLSGCRGVEVLNCRADVPGSKAGNAITASRCKGLRIQGNVFRGGRFQLRFRDCSNLVLERNTVANGVIFGVFLQSPMKTVRFVNNVFYRPCGPGKPNSVYLFRGDQIKDVVSDYNLFFSPFKRHKVAQVWTASNVPRIVGADLKEWQGKSGHDKHSIQADPMFVDVEKGDFRLKPGSPAVGAGENGANIGALGVAK